MTKTYATRARVTRAQAVRDAVTRHVETGDPPGAVWAIADADRLAVGCAGTFAPGGGDDVRPDTMFRLSSTTKPIVAALAMTLVDDGTLILDGPVDDLLPELANRRVMTDPAGSPADTVPARRSITVRDILEFRLGMGMDFSAPWPSARAADRPLPDLLDERLLTPLGMRSTGFGVPKGAVGRLGPLWMPAQDGGQPQVYDPAIGQWASAPAFPDGGDGLVSTAADLAAFARIADGGVAAGIRSCGPTLSGR